MDEIGKYQLKPYKQRALPALLTVAIMLTSSPASFANTAPNAYEPAGESWVDVSESEKVYLENFGSNWDDNSIYYVGNGIECTFQDVTANGPFLSAYGLDDSHCTDSEDSPIDPIGDSDTLGAIPFGFNVNFFGTEYDSAWPNTNGGIFFEAPDSAYDRSMGQLAFEAQSSVMFAFGADLFYFEGESNFWTAQTTVDGKDAVVFSWENFHNCCTEESSDEDMSFQIVLINFGAGDFNAYFNYESVNDFSEGYSAESIFIDLATGVSPGSNVFFSEDASFITADTCIEGIWDEDEYFSYGGDMTDSLLFDELEAGDFFFKVNDAENGLVSIWEDEACSEPIDSNLVQDIAVDGHAYLEFSSDAYRSVAVGWATFDPVNFELDWTELLRNVDENELENDADSPLVERSLNTSVPGRFVIGQRGGATVVDSATITPTLAATGANVEWLFVAGLIAVVAGSGFLAVSRRKRIW
jgi:LPXTG-motif cell wall-anchored protein